jgi:hypothetical protein
LRLNRQQIHFQFRSIFALNSFLIYKIYETGRHSNSLPIRFQFCYHICSHYISPRKYFVTINNNNFASKFVTIFALILFYSCNLFVTVYIFHFVTIFALNMIYFVIYLLLILCSICFKFVFYFVSIFAVNSFFLCNLLFFIISLHFYKIFSFFLSFLKPSLLSIVFYLCFRFFFVILLNFI